MASKISGALLGAAQKSPWTPEVKRQFEQLIYKGWNSYKIAEALGVTRNAVMGRAHRLGVRVGVQGQKPDSVPKKPKVIHRGKQAFYQPSSPNKPLPPELKVMTKGVHILNNKGGCACIIGDPRKGIQCGEPIVKGSYCEVHALRIYAGYKPINVRG